MDFNDLLDMMIREEASDLFVTADVAPSMKIHGQIVPVTQGTLTGEIVGKIIHSIMSDKQRKEFADTRECNFAIMNRDQTARFRVSAFQQRDQPGMVLRRIETVIPTMEQLKLPPVLKELAMTKRGIIIFVGATGTGKSTSLASLIGYRNENTKGHIITIEDPIEFVHQHKGCIITQREVGIDTDSFEVALKIPYVKRLMSFSSGRFVHLKPWIMPLPLPKRVTWFLPHYTPTTPTKPLTVLSTSLKQIVTVNCSWTCL